jgi:hypothetical protein
LKDKREILLKEKEFVDRIDVPSIKEFFSNLKNVVSHEDYEQKSNVIKSYVNNLFLYPSDRKIVI